MHVAVLSIHGGLAPGSRIATLTHAEDRVRAAEILLLLGTGAFAALASAFLDMGLRIPGHAVLRAVFPMAFGLAAVPRRFAGTVMGVGAVASAIAIKAGGSGALGTGALTSLILTGPLLDLALWRAKRGWRLYLGFALAGLASNVAAYAVRGGVKMGGLDRLGTRTLAEWWPVAAGTYALCGILAGLVSALVWFHLSADRPRGLGPETQG